MDKVFSHLSQFHHHVSEDVQETHNGVPQSAVSQRLLVPGARPLKQTVTCWGLCCLWQVEGGGGASHLDVLRQAVEDLFGHRHCFGEIPLPGLVNDVFSRVIPVKVTDGFLRREKKRRGRILILFIHGILKKWNKIHIFILFFYALIFCLTKRLKSLRLYFPVKIFLLLRDPFFVSHLVSIYVIKLGSS